MNKDALRKLIKAVEAGNLPEAVFHGSSAIRGHWAYTTGLDNDQRRMVFRAYNGSLDAAKALHEALVPDRSWEIWRTMEHLHDGTSRPTFGVNVPGMNTVYAADPARAWLLALLKAVEAQP
jgi:hypothetical protein